MKKVSSSIASALLMVGMLVVAREARGQRQLEKLGRGLVAVRTNSTTAYIGWRMLGTDPGSIGFNLYRSTDGGIPVQLTINQTQTTDFVDAGADLTKTNAYFVRPVIDGVERDPGAAYALPANVPIQQYISIPLQPPPGGTNPASTDVPAHTYTYTANDCSVADLDGDGEYEIVLKWDPDDSKDNSQDGHTGPTYLDAYKLNGTRLWRINLGKNIRSGAHYMDFMVYDFDGDGKAEMICRTAPGTIDGQGQNVLMPGDDPSIVYTNFDGYILTGPEYLTVFNGLTGAAMATTNYVPPRGNVSDWGDSYGNRVDRFLAGVAYLDGVRPSAVMCRGYYTRAVLAAWDWRNGQLTQRWVFDTGFSGGPWSNWKGQGAHSLTIGDVDGDGKDEITYGAAAIDDDGTGLYSTGLGHGDAEHLSVMDPDRPGQEVWMAHEDPGSYGASGLEFRDARTGALIFGVDGQGSDVGRGVAFDIDPRYPGYEMWGARGNLYNAQVGQISTTKPSQMNFGIWWDADLLRELLDGTTIYKWNWITGTTTTLLSPGGLASNNSTKATPCLTADILGDWREEVIWRTADNSELRVYTTTIPAANRLYTLMHDSQYRTAIAWQNTGYNQPPHPSFFLGEGMAPPPVPLISDADVKWRGDGGANAWDAGATTNWVVNGVWTNTIPAVFASGQSVLFDLTGTNNVPINLVGTLRPGKLTVNSPKDYVWGGSGSLAGTTTVVKAGTGTLTINTTNTFTGATAVSEGTLLVNGSLDQSPVTVRGGVWSGAIGGSGTLGQGLTMQARGSLSPGNGTNSAATLTISNGLTETGQAINRFDLSDDPTGSIKTNDLIHVIGDVNLSGTNTIAVNLLNGTLSQGVYPLIQYSGTLNGGVSNLTVSGVVFLHSLTNLPGQIALVISSTRFPTNLTWTGSAGSDWDVNTSSNWRNGAAPDLFYPFDNVRFDDSGSANPPVNLVGTLTPGSVWVDATVDYTFGGSGDISGSGGLTKTNSGTLTILTTNDYTGATLISGGMLSVAQLANGGLASAIGAAISDPANLVFDGGTLRHTGASMGINRGLTLNAGGGTIQVSTGGSTLALSGVLVGSGGLTKGGSGGLSLNASNSFLGGVIINAGTLSLNNANAAGPGTITLNGGILAQIVDLSAINTINVATTSSLVPSGTRQISGAWMGGGTVNIGIGSGNTFTTTGSMTGFSGAFALGNSAGFFRMRGSLGSAAATFDLGTSTATMNNRDGSITFNMGALAGGANTTLSGRSSGSGGSGSLYVIGGNNSSTTFSGRIVNGGDTTMILKIGTGTLTLTGTNSTYSGGTTISNGTLLVNNSRSSGTGSGTVAVASLGTLGGTGVIGGAVTVNGTLSPGGNPVGTLTISNNLVLNSGAVLSYALGSSNDLTAVSGNLKLDGTLNITDAGGFANGTYTLFTYGGTLTTNGTTNILAIGTTPNPGVTYSVDINTSGLVKLIVQTRPVADFTASPLGGVPPLTVTFADVSTGAITNRHWDFGDGRTLNTSATQVTHLYDVTGLYTVRLTVSGPLGSDTRTRSNYIVPCGTLSAISASFAVTGRGGSVNVLASTASCAWTAISNDGWIQIAGGSSGGAGSAVVGYTVLPNTGSSSTRIGTMTIAGQTFTVTQAGDTVSPTVVLTAPASGIVSNTIAVSATATDNVAVVKVEFYRDGGVLLGTVTTPPYHLNFNTTSVGDGSHCFYARAYDPANNVGWSPTNCVTVNNKAPSVPSGLTATAVSSNEVDLSWSASEDRGVGLGGYKVFRDGTQIATPLGTSYSDHPLASGTEYCYEVAAYDTVGHMSPSSAPACARTFVPLGTLLGTYNGLVLPTNAPAHANSGSIKVVVGKGGKFAANLSLGGLSSAFKGQFDDAGNWVNAVLRKGLTPVQVILHLDVEEGTDQITGTVSDDSFRSELTADRAVFSRTNPCPWAGNYTVVLASPEGTNADIPQGFGYGTLTVAATGAGKLSGVLADGTKVKGSAPVSRYGTWPLYELLYQNHGACLGWVMLGTNGTVEATVDWFRPAMPASSYFPDGFTTNVTLKGERFVSIMNGGPNPAGQRVITLGGGNLLSNIVKAAAVDAAGDVTISSPGSENLQLQIQPTTGQFSGSFMHPLLNTTISLKGVVLQLDGAGGGYFLGTNESGFVVFEPAP